MPCDGQAHGYCSQEIVTLLLTGKAHSNVFDGEMTGMMTNDDNTDKPMKGILIELTRDAFAFNGQKNSFINFDLFCKKQKNKAVPIDLRVDKKVPYEKLVKVLNILQKYKLSNLSLVTDK